MTLVARGLGIDDGSVVLFGLGTGEVLGVATVPACQTAEVVEKLVSAGVQERTVMVVAADYELETEVIEFVFDVEVITVGQVQTVLEMVLDTDIAAVEQDSSSRDTPVQVVFTDEC